MFKGKLCLTLCVLFVLALVSVPALADVVYDNGPIFGNGDGWTLNFGFAVSDTFTISGGDSTITGLSFGAHLFPGDTLESVEVSITSNELGGTTYFDQVVNTTQSSCTVNQYGFNVCLESASFNGPTLSNGTYWLNLQNAVTNTGDPAYWDENSGVGCQSPGCPSHASENTIGTIPSESFTLYGNASGTGTVPEPGSLFLLMGGVLGLARVVGRKLCGTRD